MARLGFEPRSMWLWRPHITWSLTGHPSCIHWRFTVHPNFTRFWSLPPLNPHIPHPLLHCWGTILRESFSEKCSVLQPHLYAYFSLWSSRQTVLEITDSLSLVPTKDTRPRVESALLTPLRARPGCENASLLTALIPIACTYKGFWRVSSFHLRAAAKDFNIWQVFLIVEIKGTILRWGNSLWKSDFYVDKISNSTHLLLKLFTKHPCLVSPRFSSSEACRVLDQSFSSRFQATQAEEATTWVNNFLSHSLWVGTDDQGPWSLCN